MRIKQSSAEAPMTDSEIQIEREYRYRERIGILSDGGLITESMRTIATLEADAWKQKYLLNLKEKK